MPVRMGFCAGPVVHPVVGPTGAAVVTDAVQLGISPLASSRVQVGIVPLQHHLVPSGMTDVNGNGVEPGGGGIREPLTVSGAKPGEHIRLGLGEVLFLQRIIKHVVKFPASLFIHRSPTVGAHGTAAVLQPGAAPNRKQGSAWPSAWLALDERHQASPIERLGFVIPHAAVFHERRQQVYMGRDGLDDFPG